jgi:hypothetical protein
MSRRIFRRAASDHRTPTVAAIFAANLYTLRFPGRYYDAMAKLHGEQCVQLRAAALKNRLTLQD